MGGGGGQGRGTDEIPCPKCKVGVLVASGGEGHVSCNQCGHVNEENSIVFGLQFEEGAGGQSHIVGQYVSESGARSMAPAPSYGAISLNSREMTIINGRKKITQVAAALSLTSRHVDAAHRYFLLAVQHNFIQGRRTQNVVAACLYIVCRREKAPLMLIDFSDVLQTNVYTLGSTFLKFKELLNITLPVIDPSLYIHRFAAKLELGQKKHMVAMSALRLVQSMKRDWIHHGRRPSGICGAALLIAARMHGFRRTQKEITHVVRVCDQTLRKRLGEFEATPSSDLSLAEFNETNIESEADPPAFSRARARDRKESLRKEELLQVFAQRSQEEGISFEEFVNSQETQRDMDLLAPRPKIHKPLSSGSSKFSSSSSSSTSTSTTTTSTTSTSTTTTSGSLEGGEGSPRKKVRRRVGKKKKTNSVASAGAGAGSLSTMDRGDGSDDDDDDDDEVSNNNNKRGEAGGEEYEYEYEMMYESEEESLDDLDDEEISRYLLTDDEVKLKAAVWRSMHKEYLDEQREKAKLEAEESKKAAAAGGKRKGKRKRKRDSLANATPGEKFANRIDRKESKIDHAALGGFDAMFDDDDV